MLLISSPLVIMFAFLLSLQTVVWGTVLLYVQSKGYFSEFTHSKGLRNKTCKTVPPGWQLWLHFKVAPFIFFFTLLSNKKEQTLHVPMNLIDIRSSDRSQTQKRNTVLFHLYEILSQAKLIYREGNQTSCCTAGEWLRRAWRNFGRWLDSSICICQNSSNSTVEMGTFYYM